MKARVEADCPKHVQLSMDGWTAIHIGYLGANLGIGEI